MAHRSTEIIRRVPHDRPIYGVEIGVREGKNAEALLEGLPNLTLLCVDPWRKPEPGDSYYDSGDRIAERPEGFFRKCEQRARRRLAPYSERVHIAATTSTEAANTLEGYPILDFVFLDGDHSERGVLRDITAWWPLVTPGGLLCGHDYDHPNITGVKAAVDKWFRPEQIELGGDMTWFVRKPDRFGAGFPGPQRQTEGWRPTDDDVEARR